MLGGGPLAPPYMHTVQAKLAQNIPLSRMNQRQHIVPSSLKALSTEVPSHSLYNASLCVCIHTSYTYASMWFVNMCLWRSLIKPKEKCARRWVLNGKPRKTKDPTLGFSKLQLSLCLPPTEGWVTSWQSTGTQRAMVSEIHTNRKSEDAEVSQLRCYCECIPVFNGIFSTPTSVRYHP